MASALPEDKYSPFFHWGAPTDVQREYARYLLLALTVAGVKWTQAPKIPYGQPEWKAHMANVFVDAPHCASSELQDELLQETVNWVVQNSLKRRPTIGTLAKSGMPLSLFFWISTTGQLLVQYNEVKPDGTFLEYDEPIGLLTG